MFDDKLTNLSLENVYLMHIVQMSNLTTRLNLNNKAEWQVNVRNYIATVDHLEAMTMGDLINDHKYQRRVKNLQAYAKRALLLKDNSKSNNKIRKNDFDMQLSLEYAQQRLGLIMRSLIENGKLRSRTISAVDDLPSGKIRNTSTIDASQIQDILLDLNNVDQIPSNLHRTNSLNTIGQNLHQNQSSYYEFENEEDDADLIVSPWAGDQDIDVEIDLGDRD